MKKQLFNFLLVIMFVACITVLSGCNKKSSATPTNSTTNSDYNPSLFELLDYSAVIKTNETYQITVLNASSSVSFTSRNTNVATVNDTGLITGISDGSTIIECTMGSTTLEFNIVVSEALVNGVNFRLNVASTQIYLGYELTVYPKITIGDSIKDNSEYVISYASSNSSVASISESGKV